jgi:hypothetical protein
LHRHVAFLTQLIALVDYAERNRLETAARVLITAAEEIAPTLREQLDPGTGHSNILGFPVGDISTDRFGT